MKSSIRDRIPSPPPHIKDKYHRGLEFDHSLKIGALYAMYNSYGSIVWPEPARQEAYREIMRYRDEGLAVQEYSHIVIQERKEMTKRKKSSKRAEPLVFSGQGILFTVFDHSKESLPGPSSTVKIIENAIDDALDSGHEDSEAIARFLTSHAFKHVDDRKARFNSLLKAGDAVGARLTQKMFNAYDDLLRNVKYAEDEEEADLAYAEARGFAEAMTIMFSPFAIEDEDDARRVDWDTVDHLTTLMEEQREEAKNMP